MTNLNRCASIDDLRDKAKKRLPAGIFQFLDRGAEDEHALRANQEAFRRRNLISRVLVDVSHIGLTTTVFGQEVAMPVALGPTGGSGLLWRQGEIALAKSAKRFGVPYTLPTPSNTPMATVRQVGGNQWFQLYVWKHRAQSYALIDRAQELGFSTLIVTVDHGRGHLREHTTRSGYTFPFKPKPAAIWDIAKHPRWFSQVILAGAATTGIPRNVNYPKEYQQIVDWGTRPATPATHLSMTWADVADIRGRWKGNLVVKGVMTASDARLAVEHGADAVTVSNHGGRAMDSSIATLDALPAVVTAVGQQTTVMLDGGVRRGSDVVKAIAMGADLVLLGRATLYGLAAAGQPGVDKALSTLRDQMEKTLAYLGSPEISEVGSHVLAE